MSQRVQRSPFRTDALSGKVALITGGGSGIGYEIARQYGLHGARVVIMGRREAPLRAAVETLAKEGIEAFAASGDVRSFEDCQKVVSATVGRFGRLDILVNNAAGNFLCAAEDLSPKGFKTVLEIDTMGVFNMAQAAFPALKESGDALIVNISVTLHYKATWYQIHPCAAKAAIDAMTRSFALEWGEYQIRCNGIAPGPIGGTAGLTKLAGGAGDELIASMVPINRLGSTFDIAMSAVFMARYAMKRLMCSLSNTFLLARAATTSTAQTSSSTAATGSSPRRSPPARPSASSPAGTPLSSNQIARSP